MKFHPSPELLIRYAAGSMSPAMSFVVATHIAHCDACRAQQAQLEDFGGDSIESYGDAQVKDSEFDSLWSKLGSTPEQTEQSDLGIAIPTDYQPVFKKLLDRDYSNVNWQSIAGKIDRAEMTIDDADNQIEILRFARNAKIPQHTHKGNEYTVILEGAYSDEMGDFQVGDFIHLNGDHHHRPVAGKEGCVCIAVTDAPMHFTGMLGPVLNLFSR
jgi:putative transcriptional regulator